MTEEKIVLLLNSLKNKLKITFNDSDEDLKIIIQNAIPTVNHKIGAEIDYTEFGQEQELFLNYCMYVYYNRQNEFDKLYINEIMQIREKNVVRNYQNEQK